MIADEAHHLGEELAWGTGSPRAFARLPPLAAAVRHALSLRRHADPGRALRPRRLAEPDVSYTYADAVRDGICRPVCFVAYDGTLSWRSGDDVIESSFETVLSTREASRRYRTAISTELPDGLPRILREADAQLRELRARRAIATPAAWSSPPTRAMPGGSPTLLREATGARRSWCCTPSRAQPRKLAAFTHSRDPWIVAVNMVSEGVDIPRLRVGRVRDRRQDAARLPPDRRPLRAHDPGPRRRAELALHPGRPGAARPRRARSSTSCGTRCARRGEDEPTELERDERRETERSEALEFVPLSADVAPQMTLFGGPRHGAPARARRARRDRPAPRSGGRHELPAFERRALLRDERHRLVSEVRRRDGTSHREINAWLNRKLGITSVEDATLEELERSVELLVTRLTSGR